MRYAVISDIHSNLEALRAVLAKIASLKADKTLCLGDIVGYNPNPNECVEIVRSEGIQCILGNHDAAACGLEEPDDFNPTARNAVLWTREQLTEENKAFLKNLPRELEMKDFIIFHGSIHDTNRYILNKDDIRDNFHLLERLPGKQRMGFFGHTHVKVAFSYYRGTMALELSDELSVSDAKLYLINPGSVGQPRDGDPRAAFLMYDTAEKKAAFSRVEYDVAKTQDKIIRAGLPPRLAERLSLGG